MKKEITPDKKLASVCGLYCPSCTVYIGTHEDPQRLEYIAQQFGCKPQDMECDGCRSDRVASHCRECHFVACANKKGIDFCGECDMYPCEELKAFQTQMPHRIELWDNLKRIQGIGYEKWFMEMNEHYACPACKTLNSAYDLACRTCGNTPSSVYGEKHKEQIEAYIKKTGIVRTREKR